ncbi:MAG: UDP-glucose 4-epimerase GalE [Pseudomonadota bacterium]|nr:UDP-glucose 4-epimerase GalE [Pseudomonadota bacterium]
MKPIPVLVTGGAGYVGSHACKALAENGFFPVTVDNLAYGHEWAVKWGPLIKGDINDRDFLEHVFITYRPLAVLHFAAYAYVGESVVSPDKYYRNNVAGTITLLDAIKDHGCCSLVFSSTCSTYGIPKKIPIQEDHEQKPINPYGWSKLMIEQIMRDYEQAYGIRHAILRYFNAAGADPEGELGEDHDPETHLIPLAIQAALGQRPYIEIYGTDYPTPDGTAIRDYIHVTDLAAVHVLALQYLLEGKESLSLNVGTGRSCSVREVISAIESESMLKVPVRQSPRRAGDPPILVAEPTQAFDTLGWQPHFIDIRSTVESAIRWHRK